MAKKNPERTGVSFLGLLAILFIGLKLAGHIDWSWLWVLAPLWGPVAVCLSVIVLAGIVWLFADAVERWQKGRR